ncbi:hypothetical protein ACWKSP_18120 [Micromonosporaceae bacterium Da 78-11]
MWTSFAALTGGISAGFVSLVFLVVAFRFDTIAVSDEYRNRAAQALSLFVTSTVLSALVVVPQPSFALGLEVSAAAAVSIVLLVSLDRAARRRQVSRRSTTLVIGLLVFAVAIAVSAVLLLIGLDGALYCYALGIFAALITGVVGVWTFLTQAGVAASPKQIISANETA